MLKVEVILRVFVAVTIALTLLALLYRDHSSETENARISAELQSCEGHIEVLRSELVKVPDSTSAPRNTCIFDCDQRDCFNRCEYCYHLIGTVNEKISIRQNGRK